MELTKTTDNNNKTKSQNHNSLFDDQADDSDNELNFEVKKQYEGKKGQKVNNINDLNVSCYYIIYIYFVVSITCKIRF